MVSRDISQRCVTSESKQTLCGLPNNSASADLASPSGRLGPAQDVDPKVLLATADWLSHTMPRGSRPHRSPASPPPSPPGKDGPLLHPSLLTPAYPIRGTGPVRNGGQKPCTSEHHPGAQTVSGMPYRQLPWKAFRECPGCSTVFGSCCVFAASVVPASGAV